MAKLSAHDGEEDPRRLVLREVGDQAEDRDQRAEVDRRAAAAAGSACPLMLPLSLRKAITEPEKVMAPMATPRPISIRLTGKMLRIDGPAIGVIRTAIPNAYGIQVSGRADQHRGHADEAVEGRDQLRHCRHLDLARGDQADAAADDNRTKICRCRHRSRPERRWLMRSAVASRERCRNMRDQGRHDRDRHADHAGAIASPAALRARQAPQREDEADAGDEISKEHPGGRARARPPRSSAPSSCTWRAFAR